MTCTYKNNTHHILTLKDVASWTPIIDWVKADNPEIIAGVPSLQRGAVWEPQQIEMLWDSIMRGFPIGSIVIAKRINNQNDKRQITLAQSAEPTEDSTHHILDGQQRCNAITWGFVDPWNKKLSDDVVLWLDLKPGDRLLKNSTRKYLFRVTTKAHPWGFRHDDQAGNLTTENIRIAMNDLEKLHLNQEKWPVEIRADLITKDAIDNDRVKRPSPRLAMPHDAGFPVPVSLLLKHFKDGHLNLDELKDEPMMTVIMTKSGYLEKDKIDLSHIELGLSMVERARLVALQVPEIVNGIDDIEQIFQRLNRQGTPLDNEELAYSVIKAHWTAVEEIMHELPDELHHSTEARLISLGVRVALTESNADKVMPERSVEQIRNIFRVNSGIKSEENIKAYKLIEPFFKNGEFKKALEWIDENFLYKKDGRDFGLPKYLRSSLAWYSRDVFSWLMLLAKRNNYEPIDDRLAKKIIGVALTIHWFGIDKAKAIDSLVKRHEELHAVTISELKDKENMGAFVLVPLKPEEMQEAFQLSEYSMEDQLKNWTSFWQGVVVRGENGVALQEKEATDRKEKYGLFIDKLRSQNELLVYAQRDYIETVFDGFDPSNKLMWKGHNRPWDYDHILPSQNLNGTGSRRSMPKYHEVCKAWQQSIGNLVAVDFSFNRSSQHTVDANNKYAEKDGIEVFSKNLPDFVINLDSADELDRSRRFVLAAKDRLVAIYEEWYNALKIGQGQ